VSEAHHHDHDRLSTNSSVITPSTQPSSAMVNMSREDFATYLRQARQSGQDSRTKRDFTKRDRSPSRNSNMERGRSRSNSHDRANKRNFHGKKKLTFSPSSNSTSAITDGNDSAEEDIASIMDNTFGHWSSK